MDDSFFDELSRPLEPTNKPRPAATLVRKRVPKTGKVSTLDDFFTPTKAKSSARTNAKSKLRPESPESARATASKSSSSQSSYGGTSSFNSAIVQRTESLGTIIPDSEEERKKLGASSEESEDDVPSSSRRGNQWQMRRRVLSSDESDAGVEATPTRSPKKRAIYYSSGNEGDNNPPSSSKGPSSSRTPIAKAVTRWEVIEVVDSDEDRIVQKAPESSSVHRRSSLLNLIQKPDARGGPVAHTADSDKQSEGDGTLDSDLDNSDDEIIPETQEQVDDWSDDAGVMGYISPRGLKKPFTPITPNSPFTGPSPAVAQPIAPTRSQSLKGLGIRVTPSEEAMIPDEVTTGSPVKKSFIEQAVRTISSDKEVIEISSGESEKEYFDLPGTSKPKRSPTPAKPKSKAIAKTKEAEIPSTPSTPRGKGKSKKTPGPVTPTSPSGKPMSKVAKARFLEHCAREVFDDLNEHVFNHLLDDCQLVWSKLLLTTAGKAFMRKDRDEAGQIRHNADGSVAINLTIELSTKVVDSEERVRNTLSHEMCHLSTWLVDGINEPDHGPAWKKWTDKVTRYRSEIHITTRHTYDIAYKYEWRCTNEACAHTYGRHSKSIDITKQGCGLCRSVLKPMFETATKQMSPWQEFLKQNLKTVKSENPGIKQGPAMQILSERWKQFKTEASSTPGGSDAMDDIVAGLGRLNV